MEALILGTVKLIYLKSINKEYIYNGFKSFQWICFLVSELSVYLHMCIYLFRNLANASFSLSDSVLGIDSD